MNKLTIILFFLTSFSLVAQENRPTFQVKYTFDEEWTVFEESKKVFVPYLPEVHSQYQQIHLYLNYLTYKHLDLYLEGKKDDFLFVNNRLIHSFRDNTRWHAPVDSLFGKGKISAVLLSYTSSDAIEELPKMLITNRLDQEKNSKEPLFPKNQLNPFRPLHQVQEFLFLVSLGILGIMALMTYQNKSENGIFFVTRYLNGFNRVNTQTKRTPFTNVLGYIVFYILTCSFALYFLSHYSSLLSVPLWLKGASVTEEYRNIFGFVLLFLVGQYLLIALFSMLYHDKTLSTAHYYESMQSGQLLCVSIALLVMLANTVVRYISPEQMNLLVYVFFLILLTKALLVSYRLNKLISYQNIYLFSYLCATEYVPLLIPTKIFVKF